MLIDWLVSQGGFNPDGVVCTGVKWSGIGDGWMVVCSWLASLETTKEIKSIEHQQCSHIIHVRVLQIHIHHCNYWCLGANDALAPKQQTINIHSAHWIFLYGINSAQKYCILGNNMKNIITFKNKIPSCLRVQSIFEHVIFHMVIHHA